MERVHCKDCIYMDERKLCRFNPVVPNMHIHIHDPNKEWCGQGRLPRLKVIYGISERDIELGDWVSYCCEEDLFQVTTEKQLEEALTFEPFVGSWKTREEAIIELGKMNLLSKSKEDIEKFWTESVEAANKMNQEIESPEIIEMEDKVDIEKFYEEAKEVEEKPIYKWVEPDYKEPTQEQKRRGRPKKQ